MSAIRFALCCLVGGLLAAPATSHAQRTPRQRVSGPAAAREAPVGDEQVFRLLRHQLMTLLHAQEDVRAERGRYAAAFGAGRDGVAFLPPAGVSIALTHADPAGWAAVATHAALPGKSCVIWAGQVPPPNRPETSHDGNRGGEAEVVCDLVP